MTGRTVDRPVRNPDRYRTGPDRTGTERPVAGTGSIYGLGVEGQENMLDSGISHPLPLSCANICSVDWPFFFCERRVVVFGENKVLV